MKTIFFSDFCKTLFSKNSQLLQKHHSGANISESEAEFNCTLEKSNALGCVLTEL